MPQLSGFKQLYPSDILTVDTSAQVELGTRAIDSNSNEYIYLQGTASVVANDWVVIGPNFSIERLQANEIGAVAIAATAVVLGEYGWFGIKGTFLGNSDTISADRSLYIDGTAGRVDDLSVSGDLVINAYSVTADSSNKATCYISYPSVSDDLGGAAGGISGPVSSTDNAPARWNGTAGDTLQDSVVTIGDTGVIAGGAVWQGTAVAVGYGGTGAANAGDARTNLGLVIGTDVQAFDAQLTDIANISPSASAFIGDDGTNLISRSAAETRGDLGLIVGTNVQAWDNDLDDIAALTHAASAFIVSDGTDWVQKSAVDARADLSLGTIATQASNNVSITGGSVTGITDITVADGGTGTSDFTAYAIVAGGTATGQPLQQIAGLGNSAQVLTSNGAGALPTWQAATGGGGAATASVQAIVSAYNSYVRTGDGQFFIHADSRLAGLHLVGAHARHVMTNTAGAGTVVDVVNTGTSGTAVAGTAMLSTLLNIDAAESSSNTSATAYVISDTGSAVLQNDLIRIDVDQAGATGSARGLIVTLEFNS